MKGAAIHELLDRLDVHGLKGPLKHDRKWVISQMVLQGDVLVSWDGAMGPPFHNGWCIKPPQTSLYEALWHIGLIPPPAWP